MLVPSLLVHKELIGQPVSRLFAFCSLSGLDSVVVVVCVFFI